MNRKYQKRRGTLGVVSTAAVMATMGFAASVVVGTSAASAATSQSVGILPPANPASNCSPSGALTTSLQQIDYCRSLENVGPLTLPSNYASLNIPDQLFVVTNLERVNRGEMPVVGLTVSLNALAQQGANSGNDPTFPAGNYGGGSIWAGGQSDATQADLGWMYQDGPGSYNLACTATNTSGCWGHRDNILYGAQTSGLYGGAAYSASNGSNYAMEVLSGYQPQQPLTFTWASELQYFSTPPGVEAASTPGSPAPTGTTSPACSPSPLGSIVGMATTSDGNGYWLASGTGAVAACGDAAQLGSVTNPSGTVVAIASAPTGNGYWLATSTGAVYAFGSAANHGQIPATLQLAKPIVAMAADPATGGYWLLGGDGGVFSFDAPFYGSTGNIHLNKPAVGMEATADGLGYRFVASDGGVFDYGDAHFYGSTGAITLNQPVVGMSNDPATGGYWLDAADGGIFSFNAPFDGSTGAIHLNQPCVGMAAMPNGGGYRFVAADGGVFNFGNAPFEGSTA